MDRGGVRRAPDGVRLAGQRPLPQQGRGGRSGRPAPAVAPFGAGAVGAVLLAAVLAAIVVVLSEPAARRDALASTGYTLQSCVFVGLAAASPILASAGRGGAVALVLLVSVYEMGDYLIGSGSTNSIEGPAAGIAGIQEHIRPVGGEHATWAMTRSSPSARWRRCSARSASSSPPRCSSGRRRRAHCGDSLLILGPWWVVTLWAYLDML